MHLSDDNIDYFADDSKKRGTSRSTRGQGSRNQGNSGKALPKNVDSYRGSCERQLTSQCATTKLSLHEARADHKVQFLLDVDGFTTAGVFNEKCQRYAAAADHRATVVDLFFGGSLGDFRASAQADPYLKDLEGMHTLELWQDIDKMSDRLETFGTSEEVNQHTLMVKDQ